MPRSYLNLRRGDDDLPNDPDSMDFPDLEAASREEQPGVGPPASTLLHSRFVYSRPTARLPEWT